MSKVSKKHLFGRFCVKVSDGTIYAKLGSTF